MIRLPVTLLFSFLLALAGWSQPKLPDYIHTQRLSNGLDIVVVENKAVPLVTIELAVHNGAMNEDSTRNGLAHLYEHLFFQTNDSYPTADSIINEINKLGIIFNATTSDERTNYYFSLSSAFVNEGIDFMAAAAMSPQFSAEEIESEFEIIASKFQRAESNPVHFLVKDINEALWGNFGSRKNALGERDVIFKATTAQLEEMHQHYYVPNNAILLVAGDVDHKSVFQHSEKAFGTWKKPVQEPLKVYPIPSPDSLSTSKGIITIDDRAQTPLILTAFRGPVTASDRRGTCAADVLTYMLSQKTSKLNKALVESGLAYQVAVGYNTQRFAAPFTIFLVPDPQKITESMEALSSEISKWNDPDYFSDEELENARRMLVIQELYSRENPSEVVHNLSYWWASADLQYYASYIETIESVSREDIANLTKKYLIGQPNVSGVLLTRDMQRMLNLNSFSPLNTSEK